MECFSGFLFFESTACHLLLLHNDDAELATFERQYYDITPASLNQPTVQKELYYPFGDYETPAASQYSLVLDYSEGVSAAAFCEFHYYFPIVAIFVVGTYLLYYSSTHLAHDHPQSLLRDSVRPYCPVRQGRIRPPLPPKAQLVRQQPSIVLLDFGRPNPPLPPLDNTIVDDSNQPCPPAYVRIRARPEDRAEKKKAVYGFEADRIIIGPASPAGTSAPTLSYFTYRSHAPSQR